MSGRLLKIKRKSKHRRNQETVGLVKIFEEKSLGTGKWAWRTTCRRKECPRGLVFKTHSSYEEALSFANWLDNDLKLSKKQDHDPALLVKLRDFEKKWRNRQVAGLVDYKGEHDTSTPATTELALDEILEVGSAFWDALREVNKHRISAGLSSYSADWAVRDWVDHQRKVNQPQMRISFADAIDEFIDHKSSDTGSKGKRKLSKGALSEWKQIVGGKLKNWVGNKTIGEDPDKLHDLVEKMIEKGMLADGELWSYGYRHKIASKVSQFGAWLVKKRMLDINPFVRMPDEFPKAEKEAVSFLNNRKYKH